MVQWNICFEHYEEIHTTKFWPDVPQIAPSTLLIKRIFQEVIVTCRAFFAQYWTHILDDSIIFTISWSFILAFSFIA